MGEGIPGDKIPVIQFSENQGTIFFHHVFLVVQFGLEDLGTGINVTRDPFVFRIIPIVISRPQANGGNGGILLNDFNPFGKKWIGSWCTEIGCGKRNEQHETQTTEYHSAVLFQSVRMHPVFPKSPEYKNRK